MPAAAPLSLLTFVLHRGSLPDPKHPTHPKPPTPEAPESREPPHSHPPKSQEPSPNPLYPLPDPKQASSTSTHLASPSNPRQHPSTRYAGPQHQFDALHLTLCPVCRGTCLAYLSTLQNLQSAMQHNRCPCRRFYNYLPSHYSTCLSPLSPLTETPHAIFGPIISTSQRDQFPYMQAWGLAPRMFSNWQSVACEQS